MSLSRWRIVAVVTMFLGFGITQVASRIVALAATAFPAPISFYAFDEVDGATTAVDRIRGTAGLATLFGSPTFSAGRVGNALCLNGTSQYGTAPIVSGVTSEFTISAWVKLDTLSQWATIVKNWGDANVGTFHFGLDGGTQKWSNYLGLVPNSNVAVVDPSVTTTGQWHHVITTASQSQNKIRLYVNNTKVAEGAFSGTITAFGSVMSFGAKLNDQQNQVAPVNPGWLDGCLDELAFWNVALTDAEVSDIYTSGQSGTSPIAPVQSAPSTVPPTSSTVATTTSVQAIKEREVVASTTSTTVKQSSSLPHAGSDFDDVALIAFAMLIIGIVVRRSPQNAFFESD